MARSTMRGGEWFRVLGALGGLLGAGSVIAACGDPRLPGIALDGGIAVPPADVLTRRDGGAGPVDQATDRQSACGWACAKGPGDRFFCTATHRTLPPFGEGWMCSRSEHAWSCGGQRFVGDRVGTAPVPPPGPCDAEWTCETIVTHGHQELPEPGHEEMLRCERPVLPGRDYPAGTTEWGFPGAGEVIACVRGELFGGTRCEVKSPKKPAYGSGLHDPSHGHCVPGMKQWCDGLQYGGWGQATCGDDGKWPTKIYGWKHALDCRALASGARPATACARYHFYFNPLCCEREDCIVPYDKPEGQVFGQIEGRLCDPCNPLKSECAEPGAACLITNASETFCGRACLGKSDCPHGYDCVDVPKKNSKQCVPKDFSCYD